MASPSKAKPRAKVSKESDNALRDHLGTLDNTLKSLVEAVNQVSGEIQALQPLVETANLTSEAVSSPKPVSKPAPKAKAPAPVKKQKTTAAKKPAAKKPAPTFLELVNTLPVEELIDALKNAGAKQHVVRNIINQRKRPNFQEFASEENLIQRVKGLAKPSLELILEQWSY